VIEHTHQIVFNPKSYRGLSEFKDPAEVTRQRRSRPWSRQLSTEIPLALTLVVHFIAFVARSCSHCIWATFGRTVGRQSHSDPASSHALCQSPASSLYSSFGCVDSLERASHRPVAVRSQHAVPEAQPNADQIVTSASLPGCHPIS
jgi:hypothetical protein